ncbi:hypothetical protein TPY_1179 [Sulfobacillus acidophilus TPY]|nr:hypothetical protein TPY_1179 [Sulfobacillus acidophilus TPY]
MTMSRRKKGGNAVDGDPSGQQIIMASQFLAQRVDHPSV